MSQYYFIFLLTAFISATAVFFRKKPVGWVLFIVLALFAGSRLNIDNDYSVYFDFFRYQYSSPELFIENYPGIEWSIYLIPNLVSLISSNPSTIINGSFLFFAILGVSIKITGITKYSPYFFLSIILYVSSLFLMQEMTTIRAGVASGLFLLGLPLLNQNKNKKFFIYIGTAFLFHYSSILFILVWGLKKLKASLRFFTIGVVISFLIAIFKVNLLTLLFLDKLFPRVALYLQIQETGGDEQVNIFNFRILFSLFMSAVFIYNYKKLIKIPYFDLLLKVHLLSIILFFSLSPPAMVFSLRSFELLSVVQLVLYPMLAYIFPARLRWVSAIIIIGFALLQLVYLIEYSGIFQPYKSWLF